MQINIIRPNYQLKLGLKNFSISKEDFKLWQKGKEIDKDKKEWIESNGIKTWKQALAFTK